MVGDSIIFQLGINSRKVSINLPAFWYMAFYDKVWVNFF